MAPKKITPTIRRLINSLNASHEELYLPIESEKGTQNQKCFSNVQKKIKHCGGKMIIGWQIWETKHIVEAECHAVWEDENGNLHDITPKPLGIDKILFVEDENLKYEEKQIENIRLNKSNNQLVDDLINVCKAIYRFDNKDERAFLYDLSNILNVEQEKHKFYLVELKEIINQILKKGGNRKSLCPCGSQLKFTDCHGYNLNNRIKKDV